MQTHFQIRPIASESGDVNAVLSIVPPKTCIVFVHGYSGSSVDTWAEFDRMMPRENACKSVDLIFYGYDGLFAELAASSSIFASFLKPLAIRPMDLIGDIPGAHDRGLDFGYKRILIVAHSLGAVITRWALLDLRDSGESWLDRIEMVLFSPAHKGARVKDLASEVLSGFSFAKLFNSWIRFQSPLVDQLTEGSAELKFLEGRTIAAINKDGRRPYLVPRAVIIAQYERIVSNIRFASDNPPLAFANKGHIAVCKPSDAWRAPVDAVLQGVLE